LPSTSPPTPPPVKTGAVLGSAVLASTGRSVEPLAAAGAGLVALGLIALGGSEAVRRRRTQD